MRPGGRGEPAPSKSGGARLVPALVASACVLPVAALGAWLTDHSCNHIEGDISTPEPGTPRQRWCSSVEPGHHWWALLALPVLVTLVLIAVLSLVPRLSAPGVKIGVTVLICVLVLLQAAHADSLQPAYEI